jgi:endonuclease/exonuclease/phosphatase family metal-dependent hydrolase
MLTFKQEIRDSEIPPHDERRIVWPQNMVALLGRPVDVIITHLSRMRRGF